MDCVCDILKFLNSSAKDFFTKAFDDVKSCNQRIESLGKEINELKAKRKDVEKDIEKAKRNGLETTNQVEQWLKDVKDLENKWSEINDSFNKRFKCFGDFSPNVWLIYQLSTQTVSNLEDVGKLKGEVFSQLAAEPGPHHFEERPTGSVFVGMSPAWKQLESYVQDDDVSIIGIYGMGGVGKTAFLQKFHNEVLRKYSGNVIWIDMSALKTVQEIQDTVGRKLRLGWPQNSFVEEKAHLILTNLRNDNFVLILDNTWGHMDLIKIGIPFTESQSKNKIILTTRIQGVCDRMGAKKIKLDCLESKDAWSLFIAKAGEHHMSDVNIRETAEKLVRKCGGLPLALITLGLAMGSKYTLKEWKHVITLLDSAPWQIDGMEDDVLSRLKLSYDKLSGDLKACLLYCALFPEAYSIPKEWITDFCMGEGEDLFSNMEEIYNRGDYLIGRLKSQSLLESSDQGDHIKMHPMIRSLVLYIGCDQGKNRDKWLVQAGLGLTEAPDVEKWTGAERISLMCNNIQVLSESPNCPDLVTLLLMKTKGFKKIHAGFFQFMPCLRVLDLSHTSIEEVPAGIKELVALQYLDLCGTKIRSLPRELGALLKLRWLLLSYTPNLETVPDGVIANLSQLQAFYIHASYSGWRVGSDGAGVPMEELDRLKKLKALGITVGSAVSMRRLEGSSRLAKSTRKLHLKGYQGLTSIAMADLGKNFENLHSLMITNSEELEEVAIDGGKINGNGKWPLADLQRLSLEYLQIAKIVWRGGCLHNLRAVYIIHCDRMEYLILRPNTAEITEEPAEEISPLPNVREVHLWGLRELKSLVGGGRALSLPSLETLDVRDCPKLRKLTVITAEKLKVIHGQQSWWDGLKWDNDSILQHFQHLFKGQNGSSQEH